MLAAGDDGFMVAFGRGHGAEAGQSIGENMAAGREVVSPSQRSLLMRRIGLVKRKRSGVATADRELRLC